MKRSDTALKFKQPAEADAHPIDFDELPTYVGYLVRRTQAKIFGEFEATLAGFDLTPGSYGVLTLVRANPGITQVALAAAFGVEGKIDPSTGWPYALGYNQVFVDPVSGEILGKREWGAVSLSRENLLPFLYKLHYSLHVPEMWGIDTWGLWLMGSVALLWTIDCFVGFYLTLPVRRASPDQLPQPVRRKLARGWWDRWKPAWKRFRRCSKPWS